MTEDDATLSGAGSKDERLLPKISSESMNDFTNNGRSALRPLWLRRMDPVPTTAGVLTYSFHLVSSFHRAGAQLTVLAMRRSGR